MRELTVILAIEEAILQALNEDKRVLAFESNYEQDSPSTSWQRLLDKVNDKRVLSINGHANALLGTAVGTAIAGLRPIVKFDTPTQFIATQQFIMTNTNRLSALTSGDLDAPTLLITPSGPGLPYGPQHDLSLEDFCSANSNSVVVAPAGAYEAKGLLKSVLQSEQSAIMLISPLLLNDTEEVPENNYIISLEDSPILSTGSDLTLIAWGHNVKRALKISSELQGVNIQCEVINLHTLAPLNLKDIIASINKTHHVTIIDDGPSQNSYADKIGFKLQNEAFSQLLAPVQKLSFWQEAPCYSPQIAEIDKKFTQRCINAIKDSFEKSF